MDPNRRDLGRPRCGQWLAASWAYASLRGPTHSAAWRGPSLFWPRLSDVSPGQLWDCLAPLALTILAALHLRDAPLVGLCVWFFSAQIWLLFLAGDGGGVQG